jgi:excisionase family DNA binding protein
MTFNATTKMLTLDEVAERLGVARRTIEEWAYNKDLASFKKGGCRRVSEEALTKFVLLHSLNPKRPDWLTAAVESDFRNALRASRQAGSAGDRAATRKGGMTDGDKIKIARRTVLHVLRRLQTDKDLAFKLGPGSTAFELLTAAASVLCEQPLEQVQNNVFAGAADLPHSTVEEILAEL